MNQIQLYDQDRTNELIDYPPYQHDQIPIHGQQWRDGKIHPPRKMDAVDWFFCIVLFCAIEALPIGGIIGFWLQGNIIGVVVCLVIPIVVGQMIIIDSWQEANEKRGRR